MELRELNQNITLHERLDRAYEMLESLQAKADLQATKMDGMPHGTDVSDKVGNIAIAIADLKARIDVLEDMIAENDEKIRAFANTLADERIQMAIQMRFISGFTWSGTAELLGPRFTENSVKRLVYSVCKW
jgi:hypothetical protein